jgi:hypothetical protein
MAKNSIYPFAAVAIRCTPTHFSALFENSMLQQPAGCRVPLASASPFARLSIVCRKRINVDISLQIVRRQDFWSNEPGRDMPQPKTDQNPQEFCPPEYSFHSEKTGSLEKPKGQLNRVLAH